LCESAAKSVWQRDVITVLAINVKA